MYYILWCCYIEEFSLMGTALVVMGLKGIFARVPPFPSEGQPSTGGKRQESFRLLPHQLNRHKQAPMGSLGAVRQLVPSLHNLCAGAKGCSCFSVRPDPGQASWESRARAGPGNHPSYIINSSHSWGQEQLLPKITPRTTSRSGRPAWEVSVQYSLALLLSSFFLTRLFFLTNYG